VEKFYFVWLVIGLLILSSFGLAGFRFTQEGAVKAANKKYDGIKILSTLKTQKGTYAIYSFNNPPGTVGASLLTSGVLGLAWRHERTVPPPTVWQGKPFATGWIWDEEECFLIIKAGDSRIRYISIGTTEEDYSKAMIDYDNRKKVKLDEIKRNPEIYQYSQSNNGYAAFIIKNFITSKYVVRAFDENGKLIADEFYGGDIRYIE
jgi:hypothetical protein